MRSIPLLFVLFSWVLVGVAGAAIFCFGLAFYKFYQLKWRKHSENPQELSSTPKVGATNASAPPAAAELVGADAPKVSNGKSALHPTSNESVATSISTHNDAQITRTLNAAAHLPEGDGEGMHFKGLAKVKKRLDGDDMARDHEVAGVDSDKGSRAADEAEVPFNVPTDSSLENSLSYTVCGEIIDASEELQWESVRLSTVLPLKLCLLFSEPGECHLFMLTTTSSTKCGWEGTNVLPLLNTCSVELLHF